MAKKEFTYKGKTKEEIKKMNLEEFMQLIPSRNRRSLKRGFTQQQKIFLNNLKKRDRVKTHCRELVIIPEMLDKTILVHTGKKYQELTIKLEMMGHRIGQFALTRTMPSHNSPGVGASKSSANKGKH